MFVWLAMDGIVCTWFCASSTEVCLMNQCFIETMCDSCNLSDFDCCLCFWQHLFEFHCQQRIMCVYVSYCFEIAVDIMFCARNDHNCKTTIKITTVFAVLYVHNCWSSSFYDTLIFTIIFIKITKQRSVNCVIKPPNIIYIIHVHIETVLICVQCYAMEGSVQHIILHFQTDGINVVHDLYGFKADLQLRYLAISYFQFVVLLTILLLVAILVRTSFKTNKNDNMWKISCKLSHNKLQQIFVKTMAVDTNDAKFGNDSLSITNIVCGCIFQL